MKYVVGMWIFLEHVLPVSAKAAPSQTSAQVNGFNAGLHGEASHWEHKSLPWTADLSHSPILPAFSV